MVVGVHVVHGQACTFKFTLPHCVIVTQSMLFTAINYVVGCRVELIEFTYLTSR